MGLSRNTTPLRSCGTSQSYKCTIWDKNHSYFCYFLKLNCHMGGKKVHQLLKLFDYGKEYLLGKILLNQEMVILIVTLNNYFPRKFTGTNIFTPPCCHIICKMRPLYFFQSLWQRFQMKYISRF